VLLGGDAVETGLQCHVDPLQRLLRGVAATDQRIADHDRPDHDRDGEDDDESCEDGHHDEDDACLHSLLRLLVLHGRTLTLPELRAKSEAERSRRRGRTAAGHCESVADLARRSHVASPARTVMCGSDQHESRTIGAPPGGTTMKKTTLRMTVI